MSACAGVTARSNGPKTPGEVSPVASRQAGASGRSHIPMATSTRIFDHYETEYLKLTRHAATDIELVDQLLPGAERDTTAKKASQTIQAAEEIVQSMELEARSLSGEAKQMLVAQAKDYRMGISTLSKKLKNALTSSRAQEAARDELLRGADPALRMEADGQRARLMATTERMQRGTDKLKAAFAPA